MVKLVQLAPRERQIGCLMLAGLAPKQIAGELEISAGNVNVRLTEIGRKVGVVSRQETLIWFLQNPDALLHRGPGCAPGLHPIPCACGSTCCLVLRDTVFHRES